MSDMVDYEAPPQAEGRETPALPWLAAHGLALAPDDEPVRWTARLRTGLAILAAEEAEDPHAGIATLRALFPDGPASAGLSEQDLWTRLTLRAGDAAEAARLARARQAQRDSPIPRLLLVEALLALGKRDEAAAMAAGIAAVAAAGSTAPAQARAALALAAGDHDGAALAFAEAMAVRPDPIAMRAWATCLAANGDEPRAVDVLHDALPVAAVDARPGLWHDLIALHMARGDVAAVEAARHERTAAIAALAERLREELAGTRLAPRPRRSGTEAPPRQPQVVRASGLLEHAGHELADVAPEELRRALFTHFGHDEFRPGQAAVLRSLLSEGKDTLAIMPTGAGKALAKGEPVLTPCGWRPIETIRMGDHVIGSAGTPVRVTGVFPQGMKDAYRMRFTDGAEIVCNDEHLWAVATRTHRFDNRTMRRGRRRLRPHRVLTLRQIMEEGLRDSGGGYRHYIPLVAPVAFPPTNLPLDPYLLGVLLGDGGLSTEGVVAVFIEDDLAAILPLPNGTHLARFKSNGKGMSSYRISGRTGRSKNPVICALREVGLAGKRSHEKFIPEPYLRGAAADRLALLQGLLDTDGYACGGSGAEYTTVSDKLRDGVLELVRSLGGTCSLRSKVPSYRRRDGSLAQGRLASTISVVLPPGMCPFRYPRKATFWQPRSKYQPARAIAEIIPVEAAEMICITVDAPDQLFVARDYILTHNSLTFQLPALLLPGVVLVVSPLVALMADQVAGLAEVHGLAGRATFINSTLGADEVEARLARLAAGAYSLVYLAPERLRQATVQRVLRQAGVSLLVIDEAHCLCLWGHDFRTEYLAVGALARALAVPRILAVTATATPAMQEEIAVSLGRPLRVVSTGVLRENLYLEACKLQHQAEKRELLIAFARRTPGTGIVYAGSRESCERLARALRGAGVQAGYYHAGLTNAERQQTQEQFMAGRLRVLVATVAFGMGVHKRDVRFIVHFNPARSLEAYTQEAGRAGRDGRPAHCLLLWTSADKGTITSHAREDHLTREALRTLYARMRSAVREADGGPVEPGQLALSSDDPAHETAARVGLSVLERAGFLRRGPDVPRDVELLLTGPPSDERLATMAARLRIEPERVVSRRAATMAAALETPLELLEDVLATWQQEGALDYRCGRRGMLLHLVEPPPADGAARLETLLGAYEDAALARARAMATYLESSRCRNALIARHFGETAAATCGRCDHCAPDGRAAAAITLKRVPTPRVSSMKPPEAILTLVRDLPFSAGRSGLARILRGAPGSAVGPDRCRQHGALAGMTEKRIVAAIDDLLATGLLATSEREGYRLVTLSEAGRAVLTVEP